MLSGKIKPYCRETVLLHSAFVLVEREALVPLRTIDRECSKDVVGIISHAVAEILIGSPSNHRLELSAWLFNEMCRSNSQSFDEESDMFSEFPPLPGFSCVFYLELIKELQWADLLAESLCSRNVSEEVLTALISTVALSDMTDEADTSLLSLLATTLLQAHAQSCNPKHGTFGKYHAIAVSLLEGISLVRMKIRNSIIQIDILRGVIDLAVCSVIHEALKWQLPWMLENMLQARYSLQGESSVYEDKTAVVHIGGAQEGFTKHTVELSAYNSECACPDNDAEDKSQDISTCSEEVHVILDFLFNVITHDWTKTSHWSIKKLTTSSGTFNMYSQLLTAEHIDGLSWHPLHKCFIALCGVLCLFIHCCSDSKQQQMKKLYNALVLYNQTCGSQSEKDWLHSMEDQMVASSGTTCILEEFQTPSGPIEMFLFKPDTPEELFNYSVQQVCDRSTAYRECFDWMLTAQEFYGQVEWLQCFKVHGPQLSNQEQVIKMIDILCFQWQVLTSGGSADNEVFIAVRNVILEVYSKMGWTQQEGILLYSQSKVLSHTWDMRTDSIFFDPLQAEEDRESFHQNLVETFNKLVVSTESEDFDTDMQTRIVQAALVMPYVLLSRAVEEAIKHAAHGNSIYKVHQKLSCLCGCRTFNSGPSLLSTVIKSAAVSASSKQHENNLVNLLVLLFQPTDVQSTRILALNDALEVVVLPFLFHHDNENNISTAFAVRLLAVAMTTIDMSRQSDTQLVKEHFIPIMLCLCELLDSCSQLWADTVPCSPLVDMEELKVLVLVTLGTAVDKFCGLVKREAHLSKGVVWLYRRLERFNWTVPLYLVPLFEQSNAVPTLLVPPCLLETCILPSENWTAHPGLRYGPDAVFTALFEACRVSDVMCQKFAFHPERLGPVREGSLVNSLAQVLPHCVWQEYMRVVSVCQQLINRKIIQIVCGEANKGDNQCMTSQLSCLLLKVMEFLNSNDRRACVNQHVWLHVTKHYVVALKGMCDEKTDSSVLVTLFAHVCRVMSVVSSDVTDQLFVLALDLLTRISIQGQMGSLEVSERLKECTSSVANGLHKASLLQKLVQEPLTE